MMDECLTKIVGKSCNKEKVQRYGGKACKESNFFFSNLHE